jgi:hypothetical protein
VPLDVQSMRVTRENPPHHVGSRAAWRGFTGNCGTDPAARRPARLGTPHPASAAFKFPLRAVLLACFTAAPSVQPTGTSKGTLAPEAQGESGKAARAANPKLSSGPKLDDSRGPTEAQTNPTEPPGGGTAIDEAV